MNWIETLVDEVSCLIEKIVGDVVPVFTPSRKEWASATATHPQEPDFVLEGLQGTLNKLESEVISPGYVRIAIERLGALARRFAG